MFVSTHSLTLVSQALADGTVPVFLHSPAARAACLEQGPVQLHHVLRAYNKDDIYHTRYAANYRNYVLLPTCTFVKFVDILSYHHNPPAHTSLQKWHILTG